MGASRHLWVVALSLALSSTLVSCADGNAQSAGQALAASKVPINVVINVSSTPFQMSTVTPAPAPTLIILPSNTAPVTPEPPTQPPTDHLAARVNGQDITREQFDRELRRYLTADPSGPALDSPEGQELAAQLKDEVLNALIEQALIEQEAKANDISVTEQQIDQEINALIEIRGGRTEFDTWLTANNQTEQEAREMVRQELMANAMRDRIVAQLPRTAEYIHAYHIVVATEVEAQSVQTRLSNGAKFSALAQSLSIDDSTRGDGGDLGWFTRGAGAVLWTEVEDAAFALKPDEVSPIVESPIGFHLVKVAERQTRALTAEDTAFFQQAALDQWIDRLKAQATIEKFL